MITGEEFVKFLEEKKLKKKLYKRLKWEDGGIIESPQELERLLEELGKLRLVWCWPSISEVASGKKFTKEQAVIAAILLGLLAGCGFKESRKWTGAFLGILSIYMCIIYLWEVQRLRDCVRVYKGRIMMEGEVEEVNQSGEVQEESDKVEQGIEIKEEDYIESIK